jgi:hypothetical protein
MIVTVCGFTAVYTVESARRRHVAKFNRAIYCGFCQRGNTCPVLLAKPANTAAVPVSDCAAIETVHAQMIHKCSSKSSLTNVLEHLLK